ncbi:zeta toxin family protein [Neorhizobium sp. DT-125]|uniref:zeta toxin family protein n=1 Tax=Neorhizobium sp. DT-125 TaxID=3396163 RepID=UPI003F1D9AD8
MRTPDNVERIVAAGRAAGYRVEARAIAVDPRVSWQGCHYRFEERLAVGAAAWMRLAAESSGAIGRWRRQTATSDFRTPAASMTRWRAWLRSPHPLSPSTKAIGQSILRIAWG